VCVCERERSPSWEDCSSQHSRLLTHLVRWRDGQGDGKGERERARGTGRWNGRGKEGEEEGEGRVDTPHLSSL